MIEIVTLNRDDAAAFRDIRLEALRLHPEAFSASYEAERDRGLGEHAGRLEGNRVFGARAAADLVGVAGFLADTAPKRSHKGVLWGLYVRRPYRGRGIARRLVGEVLKHAADHVDLVQLGVTTANAAALQFYEACGFSIYGTERDALRTGGRSYDEALMVRSVRNPARDQGSGLSSR